MVGTLGEVDASKAARRGVSSALSIVLSFSRSVVYEELPKDLKTGRLHRVFMVYRLDEDEGDMLEDLCSVGLGATLVASLRLATRAALRCGDGT